MSPVASRIAPSASIGRSRARLASSSVGCMVLTSTARTKASPRPEDVQCKRLNNTARQFWIRSPGHGEIVNADPGAQASRPGPGANPLFRDQPRHGVIGLQR